MYSNPANLCAYALSFQAVVAYVVVLGSMAMDSGLMDKLMCELRAQSLIVWSHRSVINFSSSQGHPICPLNNTSDLVTVVAEVCV